jgi:hypothetical protein
VISALLDNVRRVLPRLTGPWRLCLAMQALIVLFILRRCVGRPRFKSRVSVAMTPGSGKRSCAEGS